MKTSILFLSILFSACQPLVETKLPGPIGTETVHVTLTMPIATDAPRILSTATFTQEVSNCIADNKLPDPDIAANYIGWKPGVDFAEMYKNENGAGNYLFWEYDNGGFKVSGYKRSDNSYLFFFENFLCRDKERSRVFEVADAVRTRPLIDDEDMAPLNFVCYKGDQEEFEEVVAIVNTTSLNAVEAWHLDIENKDIQETTLESIRCSPVGIIPPKQ